MIGGGRATFWGVLWTGLLMLAYLAPAILLDWARRNWPMLVAMISAGSFGAVVLWAVW